jgi:hypothetical protein
MNYTCSISSDKMDEFNSLLNDICLKYSYSYQHSQKKNNMVYTFTKIGENIFNDQELIFIECVENIIYNLKMK